nr:hypothetical protein [Tanacetum cinerariifolium]
KLIGKEGSGEQANQGDSVSGGHGVSVQRVDVIAENVAEDVAPAELQRKKKRKTKVAGAGEPSHPAKKLRGDYGALGEPAIGVHKLEVFAAGLQEQVIMYENCMSQLEKFQDEKMEEVNEKFDKLCANFVEMALHLEEKFYPHLLTMISERRWLLTHGMELAIVKYLNSTEYLSVLGAAISKAVEKGMQEGLSAGITHGVEGRKLADVVAYNPSAKVDYLSALQRLENVNFSLITKLKSNKDASVDTIMNLLRLDDTLTERSTRCWCFRFIPFLGCFSLPVRRIRENIANHVSALRSVFVPLSEPLSVAALEGTSSFAHNATTALSVTFVFVSTIPPISTDDYEFAHADGQESTDVGGEAVADENIDPFPDVSNAKLNILE